LLSTAGPSHALTFLEFIDPHPAPGNRFGQLVVPLSTGNVVVTSPFDDAGGVDAGAVYLFNGSTGALISVLLGSTAGDQIGNSGVVTLTNGNFVVISAIWDNGAVLNAGAVTWCNGTTGLNGGVTAANSLVGTTSSDQVGSGGVTALSNGNYVVESLVWDNGAVSNAGAVTWGNGATGVNGAVSAANSLVGTTASDQVGSGGVTALSNGNYVVESLVWDNGAVSNAGAVTWGNGTTGVSGVVSAANSLVGSTASDQVGTSVTALSNGNYVVSSSSWDNGGISNAGAATWGSGTTGVTGAVAAVNSLVGTTAGDAVGTVVALTNGNYVVSSLNWDNGAIANTGAATWGSGTTGVSGAVSAANSLVGSTANDNVGSSGAVALTNGNYVVRSPNWDIGAVIDVGAVTWCSGTTGRTGVVSVANSLFGLTASDQVGSGVTALSNGNYVVGGPNWDNGAVSNAGAVTWANGTTGIVGAVSAVNSLVGSTASDQVGIPAATALSNGNYVVRSQNWDNGAVINTGAVTWGNGTTGVSGVVSAANSLVGSTASDQVGISCVALSNGNYVVGSPTWDDGAVANVGATTWGNGATGVVGAVSAANSLVGSTASDFVGNGGVVALSNGNYVAPVPGWDNGAVVNAGAATWGNGTTGIAGVISVANSLVGSTNDDAVGAVTPLSDGNYVVRSANWDNGLLVNAGAFTWGSGTAGVIGTISDANSLLGTTANTSLQAVVEDDINDTFFGRFLLEGAGRVRVGPVTARPLIASILDIPGDQGGWVRVTFNRSNLDVAIGSPPIVNYCIWRHVPGTVPSRTGDLASRRDAQSLEQLRAAIPPGLEVREVEGRFYALGSGSRVPGITGVLPPGTWELVASVSALQLAQYVAAVPTITNAAVDDFVVTAHTTTPAIWFPSDAVSGQSIDNLAPATPAFLTGAYASGQTNLEWAANSENDLDFYRIYRGTLAGFVPGVGNLIATVTSPNHGDVGPAGRFYKVSAVDVNGNESGFALLTPDGTSEVEGGAPVAFALDGARPNPTSGNGLNIAFALPTGDAARLELVDVTGRQVLAREVGALGSGRHTVNLAAGRRVAPGIYWVRLTQGANRQRARVAVVE